jgi:glutathione S-transferase
MKLYGFPMSPNVRRVQIALEEAGRAYELIPVDLTQGEHKKPDYVSMNPHGRVPTLVDGDLVLWESHAICDYVAALCPESKLSGQNARGGRPHRAVDLPQRGALRPGLRRRLRAHDPPARGAAHRTHRRERARGGHADLRRARPRPRGQELPRG